MTVYTLLITSLQLTSISQVRVLFLMQQNEIIDRFTMAELLAKYKMINLIRPRYGMDGRS